MDKNIEISRYSRAVVAILAFLVGILGIHRMYVGKIATGIVQLLLTITIFFLWLSAIWAFVDFLVILTGNFKDGAGRVIKNWND